MGMMGSVTGLKKMSKKEFPKATVQRCQLHVARNVLATVTRKQLKRTVADDMRSIFHASSKGKDLGVFCPAQGQIP